MDETDSAELTRATLAIAESALAANDMLAIICMHLGNALPNQALAMRAQLRGVGASASMQPSQAFLELAKRLDAALDPQAEFRLLSVRRIDPVRSTPDELRARLRLIQGGLT